MSRWLLSGMIAIALCGFIYNALAHAGLRFNADQSMPLGAYWFTPGAVTRGAIVQSCLPSDLAQYALQRQYLVSRRFVSRRRHPSCQSACGDVG